MSGPADPIGEDEALAAWSEWWTAVGLDRIHETAEVDPHDLAELRRVLDRHGFAIVRRMKPPAVIE